MLMVKQDCLNLPVPCTSASCIETKTNSNFYFGTSLSCLEGLHTTFWGITKSKNKNCTLIFFLHPESGRELLIIHPFNLSSKLKIQIMDFPSFYEDPNFHPIISFRLQQLHEWLLLSIINYDKLFVKVFLFERLCV